jgi:uncharacterized protein with ParB-like and HNH nuclease domain
LQEVQGLSYCFQNEDRGLPALIENILNDRAGRALKPSTKEEKNVVDNYNFFKEEIGYELGKLDSKQKKREYIKNLLKKVGDLRVIWVEIQSEDDAYTIFETVNARGAELSVADLLKNLIFKNVKKKSNDFEDVAKQKWSLIEENILETGIDISKFIRHYWLSKYEFVGEKSLYRAIKKEITNYSDFLDDLVESSEWYKKINIPIKEEWSKLKNGSKIYKTLFGINSMRVTQCFPLILCLTRNHERISFDYSLYLEVIEKFTFNYSSVSKLQANKVEKIYSATSIEIEKTISDRSDLKVKQKNIERSLDNLKLKLQELRPPLALFEERFKEICYKNSEPSRFLIKYILSKITETKGTPEHTLNFSEINIEHILPQSPSPVWELSKGDIKNYVNLLGNLTLVYTKYNQEAGNKSAKQKADILAKSDILITKEVVKIIKENNFAWDQNSISQRQDELADLSYNLVWNY